MQRYSDHRWEGRAKPTASWAFSGGAGGFAWGPGTGAPGSRTGAVRRDAVQPRYSPARDCGRTPTDACGTLILAALPEPPASSTSPHPAADRTSRTRDFSDTTPTDTADFTGGQQNYDDARVPIICGSPDRSEHTGGCHSWSASGRGACKKTTNCVRNAVGCPPAGGTQTSTVFAARGPRSTTVLVCPSIGAFRLGPVCLCPRQLTWN